MRITNPDNNPDTKKPQMALVVTEIISAKWTPKIGEKVIIAEFIDENRARIQSTMPEKGCFKGRDHRFTWHSQTDTYTMEPDKPVYVKEGPKEEAFYQGPGFYKNVRFKNQATAEDRFNEGPMITGKKLSYDPNFYEGIVRIEALKIIKEPALKTKTPMAKAPYPASANVARDLTPIAATAR